MPIQSAIDALSTDDDWAVRAAEILLSAAYRAGCSDLHVLCRRDFILARGRRQGDFVSFAQLAAGHRDMLIARLKILGKLPTFVRHEPQDGRIEWRASDDERPLILRISFLPTIHGENVVVRFPEHAIDLELDRLGMAPDVLAATERLLSRPEGTILLTGPSSSGKTSTIYAMLAHLQAIHGERLNFLTIEDPVERDLGFAGQIQVDEAKGLTFERTLRAALRQDPNVLMIGEIRDQETARTALQAGMTGHLVLSTLHAGRSHVVFSRLLSIGVSRYLVASALTGVMAQRLVRLLCRQCRIPADAGGFTSPGCEACNETGHEGRRGIFEMVPVGEGLRGCILSETAGEQVTSEAARFQVGSLPVEARGLVEKGIIDRREYENLFSGEDEISSRSRI